MGEYYPYFFVGQLFVRTDLLVSMLDAPDVGDGDVQLDDPLIGEVGVGAHLVHFDFHGGGERQRFSGGTIALSARVGPPVVDREGRDRQQRQATSCGCGPRPLQGRPGAG